MSGLQRIVLIVAAVWIFLSTSGEGSLEVFIMAVLLFFALSPLNWFLKQTEDSHFAELEESNANANEDEIDFSIIPLPQASTSEERAILKLLLQLRSAEIGSVYDTLRSFQARAADGNWIPVFMKEKAVSDLYYAPWVTVEEDERIAAEGGAEELFNRRYNFCTIAPTDLYEDEISHLQVALASRRWKPKMMIRRLEEVRSFGVLTEWIDPLIQQYRRLDEESGGGDYLAIFRSDRGYSFKSYLEEISSFWTKACRVRKMSIILNQGNSHTESVMNELHEIEALIDLELYLDDAITQPNSKPMGFTSSSLPDEAQERFFFQCLKNNEFWRVYS